MLTPEAIANKQFTVRTIGRGYDATEVDDFLDQVMVDYGNALRQLQDAQAKASSATTAQVPQVPTQFGDAARLLAVAQQTADQQIEEAKAQARQIVDAANGQAAKIVSDANAQAAQVVAQGNSTRHEIIGKMEVQRGELQSHIDALAQAKSAAAEVLQAALDKVKTQASGTSA
jgi:cell division initiation protein